MARGVVYGGLQGGVSKQESRDLKKRIANLSMIADVYDRTENITDVAYDGFDGGNEHSAYKVDLTSAKFTEAIVAGTTNIVDKVDNPVGFLTGQEVTIYDDVNFERRLVTRGEVVKGTTIYDRTTPTTVVNSAYSPEGNGGRKLVRLSNGWLVSCITNNGAADIFYKSMDNGLTWSQICYYNNTSANNSSAIISYGTMVYHIRAVSGTTIYFNKFDATTVTNTNLTAVAIDTGQTATDKCSLTINSQGTELYACWSSKNATYPNSFNIRYAKGTINTDGTVTWSSVEQVTKVNDTSRPNYAIQPSTVVWNNNPIIFFAIQTGVSGGKVKYGIYYNKFDGTSWGTSWYLARSSGYDDYVYSKPCAVMDKNGRIWVIWLKLSAANPTEKMVSLVYSDNGGGFWEPTIDLTPATNTNDHNNPTISVSSNGDVYFVFEHFTASTSSPNNSWIIRYIKFDGTNYSNAVDMVLDAGTSHHFPASVYDPEFSLEFEQPLIIYKTDISVKFYGKWNEATQVPYLQIEPLQNAYKKNAKIARTTAKYDVVDKSIKFDGYDGTITYDRTTPTTVINQAYDTSGNGGRRTTRTLNGNIVSVVTDKPNGKHYIRISTDGGATFTLLGDIVFDSTISNASVSIVSKNNLVYCLFATKSGTTYQVRIRIFDVTNFAGTQTYATVYSGETDIQAVSLAINPQGTELHACWSSKNSTYPNSFNIRYSKGTINADGSVTWGGVEQVTNRNGASYSIESPTIVIRNNIPFIICTNKEASNFYLAVLTTAYTTKDFAINSLSNGWGDKLVFNGSTYVQSNPSAVVKKKGANVGRIWNAWHGTDAVDNTVWNVRVAYSDDGGANWTVVGKITTGNTLSRRDVVLVEDEQGNIYAIYHDNTTIYYRKCDNGTTVFGAEQTYGTGTNPSALADGVDFTRPLVTYMSASQVKFSGKWQEGIKILTIVEDVRYNKVSDDQVTDTTFWLEYENDVDLTIESHLSITAIESYTRMKKNEEIHSTLSQRDLGDGRVEDTFNLGTAKSDKGTLRFTMTRTNTSVDKKITKMLGAVGQ